MHFDKPDANTSGPAAMPVQHSYVRTCHGRPMVVLMHSVRCGGMHTSASCSLGGGEKGTPGRMWHFPEREGCQRFSGMDRFHALSKSQKVDRQQLRSTDRNVLVNHVFSLVFVQTVHVSTAANA